MSLPSIGAEYVPIEPLRDHLNQLRRRGMTRSRIADLSGVSVTTIANLVQTTPTKGRDVYTHALATTADALYAVTVDLGVSGTTLVSSASTIRRIQALVVVGYSRSMIGNKLGVSRQRLLNIEAGTTVTRLTGARIRALYQQDSMRPPVYRDGYERGSAIRAQNEGRAKGWRSPGDWLDIERGLLSEDAGTVTGPVAPPALLPNAHLIPSQPSVRRMRALAIMGYTPTMVGAAIGLSKSFLSKIDEEEGIGRRAADLIRAFYQRSAFEPPVYRTAYESGAARRSQIHARESGWHGPLDWEDIEQGILAEDAKTLRSQDAVDPELVARATRIALSRKTEDIDAELLTIAEKEQIVRNLRRAGMGIKLICRITKIGRSRVLRATGEDSLAAVTSIRDEGRAAA
ncbi:hypothetical protein GCM10025867_49930 (plasmid) [Frondihabitans sucicola]|uniref:XRE family transcriptional regulator n=1 Tax=Frondihabitans sucicola TaxID=1268041 RepID=A0ABM8GWB4_9MICO|nr:hypothetical protein [Frondihabitans sucicola]BDZ52752.1 hypothetical protein GCM10025867_49930 [Frondihabitans sucicola]